MDDLVSIERMAHMVYNKLKWHRENNEEPTWAAWAKIASFAEKIANYTRDKADECSYEDYFFGNTEDGNVAE